MRNLRSPLRLLLAAVAVLGMLVAAAPANAAGQCTSNFVFYDGAGNVYIGQAAHCTGTGSSTDTNGCQTSSLPLGSPVEVEGAAKPGTLAYNSWLTMAQVGEKDADTCQYNDLALVKLDPADAANVNPTVK